MMEKVVISGITYNKNETKITINKVPDKPGVASKIFSALSAANIVVDMIVQNVSHESYNDITFTVVKADGKKAFKITGEIGSEMGQRSQWTGYGQGFHRGAGHAFPFRRRLQDVHAPCRRRDQHRVISTSEIKISCVIGAIRRAGGTGAPKGFALTRGHHGGEFEG